ncbi:MULTISPECIES: aliphatic sulfonate ABC transporter permease SsuC [Brevibacillus]|jgi:sulfonate transport system permease protein|uniref:aliphatic sulfonate ABC transporter permease SsuC n=1 Tax=Brevibacillus TaxID=55080 RepID=UPI001E392C30|nr:MULTISPECIES: aliphatic sulfonate ABC transporter permease SsuC [Bacillales]MDT3416077.1 sulfonate transport system permease protein [Brevibacillus aydinogluensis]UFJ61618.1 aliphatic sulfonate ABC transporter permease SsuC [Anoxybacillus sediminis]
MRLTLKTRGLAHVIPWSIPLLVILVWQVLGDWGIISTRVLPTPVHVVEAAVQLVQDGELFDYIAASAKRALIGFLIGGGLGFFLGLLNGVFPPAEKLLDTSVQMVRTIPHLALIPLVILWFGIGEEAKLVLVALGVLFPIYVNTFHGIRTVDHGLLEMGRVYGLSGFALFWNVILPGALPSILVGVRYALGVMWMSLIVAETIASDSGIGYMATNAREFMQMDVVVLSILLYALLGKLSDSIAKAIERRWLQWHPSYSKR